MSYKTDSDNVLHLKNLRLSTKDTTTSTIEPSTKTRRKETNLHILKQLSKQFWILCGLLNPRHPHGDIVLGILFRVFAVDVGIFGRDVCRNEGEEVGCCGEEGG